MGICPCTRDAKPAPLAEDSSPLAVVETSTTTNINQKEVLNVHLRADQTIVRLTGPLSAYYKLLEEVSCEGDVKTYCAEYLATKQRCLVTGIPKSIPIRKGTLERMPSLDHPHLLRTYEVCQDQHFKYVVSELCAMTLQTHTRTARLAEAAAATVIHQVLYALAYCHAQGLRHGALSLRNIYLKEAPKGDLYIVRVGGFEDSGLLSHGVGQPYLPAPEVLLHNESTEQSDIWSCGVILYYLLSGSLPYELSSVRRKYPGFSFPPDTWSNIHSDAISLVAGMLKKNASSRPSAMQCLANSWVRSKANTLSLTSRIVISTVSQLQTTTCHSPLRDAVLQFMVDRVLNDLEITRLTQVFSSIDRDHDGIISRIELIAAFSVVNPPAKAERLADQLLQRLDKNQNGQIDYSEFLLSASELQYLMNRANLKLAFDALDKDKSGQISLNELKAFFRINSKPGSVEQWKALIAGVDSSGDGEIGFDEFEQLMKA